MNADNKQLQIQCPSFGEDGQIPKKHTGFGENISPEFLIDGLAENVASMAIMMDDLDVPIIGCFTHWLIWNLPAASRIAENIPYGAETVLGAKQGIAYGKHRYAGPKQPPFIRKSHRYRFAVYALDCMLDLPADSSKEKLLNAMSGHVLQSGEIIGWYKP